METLYKSNSQVKPGMKINHWTVQYKFTKHGLEYCQCECVCKTEKLILTNNLRRGLSKSCGCKKNSMISEANSTHGMTHTPEYKAWCHIRERCYDKNCKDYKNYGARGIKVCDRWLESFENFFEDMGLKPHPSLTIERKDNDSNYEKSNCVWDTRTVQCRHKRDNRIIEYNSKSMCLSEWAEETGIPAITIHMRIKRGMSIAEALSKPVGNNAGHEIEFNGEIHSLSEWARILGVPYSRLRKRLESGWEVKDAFTIKSKD